MPPDFQPGAKRAKNGHKRLRRLYEKVPHRSFRAKYMPRRMRRECQDARELEVLLWKGEQPDPVPPEAREYVSLYDLEDASPWQDLRSSPDLDDRFEEDFLGDEASWYDDDW